MSKFITDLRTGVYMDLIKMLEAAITALPDAVVSDKWPIVAKIVQDGDTHTQLSVTFGLKTFEYPRAYIWVDDPSVDSTLLKVSIYTELWNPALVVYITLDDRHPASTEAGMAKAVDLVVQFIATGELPDVNADLEASQVFSCLMADQNPLARFDVQIPTVGIQYNQDGQPEPMVLRPGL